MRYALAIGLSVTAICGFASYAVAIRTLLGY
jgi:hypothetical protein